MNSSMFIVTRHDGQAIAEYLVCMALVGGAAVALTTQNWVELREAMHGLFRGFAFRLGQP